jgi:putative membrane protein
MRASSARWWISLCIPLLLCLAIAPGVRGAQSRPRLDAHEQAFVAQATADDAMQIALGQLAMSRSSNSGIRALASKIVSDHTALNLQFAQLAASTSSKGHAHGVPPGNIAALKAHLQQLHGEAFDQAFAGMMVKEHRKIIAAYEVAAKTSHDSRLRTIAARGLPVLQGHLEDARALMKDGSAAERRREEK